MYVSYDDVSVAFYKDFSKNAMQRFIKDCEKKLNVKLSLQSLAVISESISDFSWMQILLNELLDKIEQNNKKDSLIDRWDLWVKVWP